MVEKENKSKTKMEIIKKASDFLIRSTIRIDCSLKDGFSSSGTGFIFDFSEEDNKIAPLLITNKHVVENSESGLLKLVAMKEGKQIVESYDLKDFESMWIHHPEKNIDLAVLPLGHFIDDKKLISNGIALDYFSLKPSMCLSAEEISDLGAIEDIIMIGYPDGIMDELNYKPVTRKGITATDYKVDYEGEKDFLVDINCFEGSSGSPIFLYNEGAFIKDGSIHIGNNFKLLGVLYAGYDKEIEGDVKKVNIKTRQYTSLEIPLNLGAAIKIEKVLEFKDILGV